MQCNAVVTAYVLKGGAIATHDVDKIVLTLIGSDQADTRPTVAKQTGLEPSTMSAAMSHLVEAGIIAEAEHSVSMGGWCARRLIISDGAGILALVELGAHHGLIALTNPTRGVGQTLSLLIDTAERLQAVLDAVMSEVSHQKGATGVQVGDTTLAVPGPMDAKRSRVIHPARMSRWDGINVTGTVTEQCGLPAPIKSDARMGTIGGSVYRRRPQGVTPIDMLIYVKAGSAIGDAYLAGGMPQVGQGGLAGDISYIPVEAAAGRPCKHGNVGRLETITSADSIRVDLVTTGLVYENNAQFLAVAHDGTPEAATATRQAGILLGHCVTRLASFPTPRGIIVGGAFPAVGALTVEMRVAFHQSCPPSIMKHLATESSRPGREATFWGFPTPTPSKISKENRS